MNALEIRAESARLVADHAARLGMDEMASTLLVTAIGKLPADGAPASASHDHEGLVERLRKVGATLLWFQDHEHAEVSDAREAWDELRDTLDGLEALSTPKPATSEVDHWIALEDRDASVPLLVGCWVETEGEPPRWSAWTAYPGEPLGCDGTWGDPPTHCQPLPSAPSLAALAGKDVEP